MSQTFSEPSAKLDQTLIEMLAEHLACEVSLVAAVSGDPATQPSPAARQSADGQAGKAAIEWVGPTESRISLRLPGGGMATWLADAASARQSALHAETVLALQTALNDREQLQSETDALATQVANDFEELSLIRSLASSMELPSTGAGINELALKSLRPLAAGVGAVSIAAVFLSDDGQELLPTCWSGEPVARCETLHRLIREFRQQAEMQPVVRNATHEFLQPVGSDALRQFMMVQCRSEGRLHGWLIACNRVEGADDHLPWAQLGFTTVQASLMETATSQLAAQLHNMRLLKQKEELFTDVVRALVNAVEARDPYTCGHSERVARFSECLGRVIGESSVGCERLYLTGLLHDVGKIAVPDGVLRKPGHLDKKERAIIETHTEAGWRILHELEALRDVLPGVLYHHERYDGNGYPDGLKGENIPLDGRILAVCDAFDAMTSDRPYRQGMPIEKASVILRKGSGSCWDPKLVEAFVDNVDVFDQIRQLHRPRRHATRPAPVDGQPTVEPVPNP